MKITGRRVLSAVMLVGAVVTTYQILSKPQPVAVPQDFAAVRANAQSFEQKLAQVESQGGPDRTPQEVHFTSEEVSAELAQSMGAGAEEPKAATPVAVPSSADSIMGEGNVKVQNYQVKLEGDVARGQFLTQVAGKDIYVTLAGHLGSQDRYITFDPTEFQVGDFTIPVSLVNSALQKKLVEQREQLKLPEGIAGLRVENGELVLTQK